MSTLWHFTQDAANTVSVGMVGGERRIVNVANGTLAAGSTDAVTGDQLFAEQQARIAADTTQAGQIAALEASDTTQNDQIAALQASDAAQNGQIAALQASDTAQNTAIAANSTAIAANTAAITTLAAESAYVTINSTGPGSTATGDTRDERAVSISAPRSLARARSEGVARSSSSARSTRRALSLLAE